MAQENHRGKRVFFSRLEATAGTPSTTNFFEGHGKMTLPEPEYQFESNVGKLGTGEHGFKQELQAAWTPWTYEGEVLSEYLYFLSYVSGKSYTVSTSGDLERHQLDHLPVTDLTLPTFTMEYGRQGVNKVVSSCVVNELALNITQGGNGVAKFTASGFGSRHRIVDNARVANAAGSIAVGVNSFNGEPALNYRCFKFWLGTAADIVSAESISFTGEDLTGSPTDITTLVNSCTFTINNGMTAADMARAGGCGVLNDFTRQPRTVNLELGIRKDDASIDTDALILADTRKAFELQYNGSYISGSDPYALDILLPNIMLNSGAEDDGTPINKTIPFTVFEDYEVDHRAYSGYGQTQIATAYNS